MYKYEVQKNNGQSAVGHFASKTAEGFAKASVVFAGRGGASILHAKAPSIYTTAAQATVNVKSLVSAVSTYAFGAGGRWLFNEAPTVTDMKVYNAAKGVLQTIAPGTPFGNVVNKYEDYGSAAILAIQKGYKILKNRKNQKKVK